MGIGMLLELKQVEKSFPGVQALRPVDFRIAPYEVVGLVGENGAGKSTLMRILTGVYQPDGGQIVLHGKPTVIRGPRDAYQQGIGMVFQEQSLLPNITVAENIFLANEQQFCRFGVLSWPALSAAARKQLEKVGLDIDPMAVTSTLNFAQRQMVELAKVLTLEERTHEQILILLDEPTSVLEQAEIDLLFDRVRALRARASFIFVSHRLDEVLEISDRVCVMKDGELVESMAAADADIKQLHRKMVGRSLQSEYYREHEQAVPADRPLLQVRNISVPGKYTDVSFVLRPGDVLGIAGVIGSGREELTRTLFGFLPPVSGSIEIDGTSIQLNRPSDAVRNKIGYIPRERRTEGLVLGMSVSENISLARLETVKWHGMIDRRREIALGREWIKRLTIRPGNPFAACRNLSGGNQQKVVLAKWVNAGARVLVLDHPTRGLDVGAKEDVYGLIRQLTAQGIGVILTADTLEETIGLSSRVLVMKDGKVTATYEALRGQKPSQVDLISHMV
jgi:ribose transport system ATP-binding protein